MLRSLGLGGDGDEVETIERVEPALGIAFDIEDCERVVTVGDVWRAVLKERRLAEAEAEAEGLWPHMVEALCGASGVNGDEAGRETLLLAEPLREQLGRALRRLLRR